MQPEITPAYSDPPTPQPSPIHSSHGNPDGPGWFNVLGQRIRQDINPESVLDAGCGTGTLVEVLHKAGIHAEGVDPSTESIDSAVPAVREFLQTAPLHQAFPKFYDLILCIDSLSGLSLEDAEVVITNLTRHTDDILFSEPPQDGSSAGDWAVLFFRLGFLRDFGFDASFIAPWAARYRRQGQAEAAMENVIREYEARILPLWEENAGLREKANRLEVDLERQHNESEIVVNTLSSRLKQWESIWADIEKSEGWKFIHRTRLLRLRLAPPGSRRAVVLRTIRESPAVLKNDGFGVFVRHWRRGLFSRNHIFGGDLKSIETLNAEAYPHYIAQTALSQEALDRRCMDNRTWAYRPLISLVTPVYKPPLHILRAMIESVLAQSYENWELCIADASPDSPEIRALLAQYDSKDERIRVKYLEENLGICGNGNAALRMAGGEFIAILDHDDVLAPQMLDEVVRRLQANRIADLIYFDEDKLSEDGSERRDPFFKPDFSPEMLVSANYLTHAVYRRSLVEEVGGFDPAFEGCQDWDLAFKITERTDQVEHIPHVLYHWRQLSGSTAGDFGAKAYVFERQLQCVRDHLSRLGLENPQTSFPVPGFLRAQWQASGKKVSIIIPTKDRADLLQRTINSLKSRTQYPDFEIIIVDNGSKQTKTLKYFEQLRGETDVKIIAFNEPFNYSRANNTGAAQATGDILLFLNNDVEILDAGWLEEMVRWVDRPEIGVVGAKLLYPDRLIQHAGVVVGMEGHASHVFWGYRERQSGPFGSVDWYRNFSAITGACMMVRRDTFDVIGGFDEKYILAFSDIEFCMRVTGSGLRVVFTPFARLVHFEGKSRGDHIPSNDIRVGIEDFMPLVERGDPFYNPNLSYAERKPLIRPQDEEDRVSRLLRVAAGARVNDLTRRDEDWEKGEA